MQVTSFYSSFIVINQLHFLNEFGMAIWNCNTHCSFEAASRKLHPR